MSKHAYLAVLIAAVWAFAPSVVLARPRTDSPHVNARRARASRHVQRGHPAAVRARPRPGRRVVARPWNPGVRRRAPCPRISLRAQQAAKRRSGRLRSRSWLDRLVPPRRPNAWERRGLPTPRQGPRPHPLAKPGTRKLRLPAIRVSDRVRIRPGVLHQGVRDLQGPWIEVKVRGRRPGSRPRRHAGWRSGENRSPHVRERAERERSNRAAGGRAETARRGARENRNPHVRDRADRERSNRAARERAEPEPVRDDPGDSRDNPIGPRPSSD